ncbi:hypothetical protein NPIL_262261 [Nephila pilipes]|uniref:Uncharacterized protein n=1 Tax=Nephila pilipes TaxID=299642 RepID=A0A8X6PRJ2_NEPPI|nr:hypothetical protein NPIL_262261 [Nephila pilipes]
MTTVGCICSSGNQTLCDELGVCVEKLSVQYKEALEECVREYSKHGVGRCSEHEQCYESDETRWKIRDCIKGKVNQEKLNDKERTEMDNHLNCVRDLDKYCPTEN